MLQDIAPAALRRLLRPRSLAVLGGAAAAAVVQQSMKLGFKGDIWPIHPRHTQVAGRRAFARLADLPAVPDAVFVGVNRHATIDVVEELATMRAGGAVCYASGFAEAGVEGAALQARLAAAAGGMPFFGPNCYGFINYFDNALCWPDQFGGAAVARGAAIITQSGNIGLNLTMHRRRLPIGYVITLGNQAGAGIGDVMQAVLDDARVTAIGVHIESMGDAAAFASAVARARACNVPVVVLKTGRTAAGARIAQSHTAAMASEDAVAGAFFRRIGVGRVKSVPALLEALKILHVHGALPGRAVASLSCSGGEAALMADAAWDAGLHFAPLSAAATSGIAATLPGMVTVSNPLDYHTFGWRNRAALAATFSAMMRAGADLNVLILDYPSMDRCDTADWDIAAYAMADAAMATGSRAAVPATLPEAMPEAKAALLAALGIVPLCGMVEGLEAIAAAADTGGATGVKPLLIGAAEGPVEALSEFVGKCALAAWGVSVPDGVVVHSETDAVRAATALGFPVAIKASSAKIVHKTEAGLVRLQICDEAGVRAAAAALLLVSDQILVERMVAGGVAELIVGVARDAALGLYLMIGSGGVLAELVGDTATLMLPALRGDIEEALRGLRVARIVAGFRGGAAGDFEAAVDTIMAVAAFAAAHAGDLHALDVNPLIVRKVGQGAVAADVVLGFRAAVSHD